MRLHVLCKGQRLGIADPAARQVQRGITVACAMSAESAPWRGRVVVARTGFLQVSPHEVVDHIGGERRDRHCASSPRGGSGLGASNRVVRAIRGERSVAGDGSGRCRWAWWLWWWLVVGLGDEQTGRMVVDS